MFWHIFHWRQNLCLINVSPAHLWGCGRKIEHFGKPIVTGRACKLLEDNSWGQNWSWVAAVRWQHTWCGCCCSWHVILESLHQFMFTGFSEHCVRLWGYKLWWNTCVLLVIVASRACYLTWILCHIKQWYTNIFNLVIQCKMLNW